MRKLLAVLHLETGALGRGDVFEGQEDAFALALRIGDAARVEQHDLFPDGLELVLDLEVLDRRAARQQLFEQLAQPRDVPLAVAELVDEPAQHLARRDGEGAVERAVGAFDAQAVVEHQERLAHRVDGVLGDPVGHDSGRLGALEGVDVEQHQHRAVDPVVEREVGAHAQLVACPADK